MRISNSPRWTASALTTSCSGLFDPKLVKFQFQCSTISDGYDAAEYFMKYPGHFISMHVQDWNPKTKKTVAVGQGSLDWKKIFTAAKTGGVKNYFVEMNLSIDEGQRPVSAQFASILMHPAGFLRVT